MRAIFLLLSFFIFTSCSSILFYPDPYLYIDAKKNGFDVTEEFLTSTDGVKFNTWFLKHKTPREGVLSSPDTLVLFFHGNAQNVSAHFANVAWMSERGIDVYMIDYRGYGISEGEPESYGAGQDVKVFLNSGYAKFKTGKYKKLVLLGQSLGGCLMLHGLIEFPHKDEVNLAIFDSTFINPKPLAHDKVWGIGYLIVSGSNFSKNLDHINMPSLVVHGENDTLVPIKFGKDVYEAIHLPENKKWFWSIEKGSHIGTFHENAGIYRDKTIELIQRL